VAQPSNCHRHGKHKKGHPRVPFSLLQGRDAALATWQPP
jgi:hypothetical protein